MILFPVDTLTPTRDDLLDAWIDLQGDLDALRAKFALTTAQLRAFCNDPANREEIANWEAFRTQRSRLRALDHQDAAADTLRQTLTTLTDPIELRRAASALARLTRAILNPRTPTPTPTPTPASTTLSATPAPEPDDDAPEPDPTQDQGQLLRRLAASITKCSRTRDPDKLRPLHAQLAPDATINDIPAAEDPDDFVDSTPAQALQNLITLDYCQRKDDEEDPSTATYELRFTNRNAIKVELCFRLEQAEDGDPWLVTSIARQHSPPSSW